VHTVGRYEIQLVTEGTFWLDGGAMFGVIPKALWNRAMPADEKNRIHLALHTLLVRDNERCILIDTGMGDKFDAKSAKIYGVELVPGGLRGALERSGVAVEDVTDVIYTHLHFDHAGGATCRLDDGSYAPIFPNAQFHVQQRQWEWAVKPTERDGASYLAENLAPIEASGRLVLHDGDQSLAPGIRLVAHDTHTVGHQMVFIEDEGQTFVHCGDLIPTSNHIRLPFIMSYDLFPLGTLQAKKELLGAAVENDYTLFFEHDPQRPVARIARRKRDFEAREPG